MSDETAKTAADLLARLNEQRQFLEQDKQARNDRRVVIAGRALAAGGLTLTLAKLRAGLQDDDDQRLFADDVIERDGWTKVKGQWRGVSVCPHAPERPAGSSAGTTSVASVAELAADEAAEAAWTAYLVEMSDPAGWEARQRRRAYLCGQHFRAAVQGVSPASLAQWATGEDEIRLWDADLLQLDGWAVPSSKRHKGA